MDNQPVPVVVQWIGSGIGAAVLYVVRGLWNDRKAKKQVIRELVRGGEEAERIEPRNHDPFGSRNVPMSPIEQELQNMLGDARVRIALLESQVAEFKPKAEALVTEQAELLRERALNERLQKRLMEQDSLIKEFESGAIYSRLESEIRDLKDKVRGLEEKLERAERPTVPIPEIVHIDVVEVDGRPTQPIRHDAVTPLPGPLPRPGKLPTFPKLPPITRKP